MARNDSSARRGTQPETRGIDVMHIKPGARIELNDGSIVEVVENPADGYWLMARYLSSPSQPAMVGEQDMVFFEELSRLINA